MTEFHGLDWSGLASAWPLDPDAPTLVLLHGATFTARFWQPVLAMGDWPVQWLAPDLPGRGHAGGAHFEDLAGAAQRLSALIEGLGLKRVTLAGHSLGGALVLESMLAAPAWLERAALISSGARLRVAPPILALVQAQYKAYLDSFVANACGPGADKAGIRERLKEATVADSRIALADFMACDRFDRMEVLANARQPALVVHGDADRVTPIKYGEYLAQQLPQARFAQLPGAGHLLPLERPDELRAILVAWATQGRLPAPWEN